MTDSHMPIGPDEKVPTRPEGDEDGMSPATKKMIAAGILGVLSLGGITAAAVTNAAANRNAAGTTIIEAAPTATATVTAPSASPSRTPFVPPEKQDVRVKPSAAPDSRVSATATTGTNGAKPPESIDGDTTPAPTKTTGPVTPGTQTITRAPQQNTPAPNKTMVMIQPQRSNDICDRMLPTFRPIALPEGWRLQCVNKITSRNVITPPGENVIGLTSPETKIIQIARGLDEKSFKNTATHELAHAYSLGFLSATQRSYFADRLGKTDFFTGTYYEMPAEVWAASQAACVGYPDTKYRTVDCKVLYDTEKTR